ncbi:hypothetical protein SGRIM128S_07473 [Streptomyces griseomycini]
MVELPDDGRVGGAGRAVGVTEDTALPQRVVGVADGQRRPVGTASRAPRGVGAVQVAGEDGQRPAVGGDVVHEEQQHMLARGRVLRPGQAEQPGPHGPFGGQVEPVPGGLGEAGVQFVRRHVDRLGFEGHGVADDLVRAFGVLREDGAQRLVPVHEVGERGGQGPLVEGAGEPQRERHVVRRGGTLVAVEEPQPRLRVRQGQPLGAVAGRDGLAGAVGGVQAGREPGDGRRLEQHPQGQLGAEGGPDAADEPGGEQGVPAEGEEVVVDGDPRHAEHIGEQGAQDLLARGARRPPAAVGVVRGCGQGPTVELPVRGQRQRVQGDEQGRHHVVGQGPGGVLAQHRGLRGPAVGGHHVGDQAPVAGPVLAHRGGGQPHVRVGGEGRLDLAELDPEAAQFHLVVGAGDEPQTPVRGAARQVAGAVHAGAGRAVHRAVRVGDEPLGREVAAVEVAADDAGSGDVQLAHDARRDRAKGAVEDVRARVGDRDADVGGLLGPRVDDGGGGPHGGLGRAVHVEDGGGVPAQGAGQGRGQRLAAGQHAHPVQGGGPAVGGERLPEAGGGLHDGDAVSGEERAQGGGVARLVPVGEDDLGAVQEGAEDLQGGDVEAHGGHGEQPVSGDETGPAAHVVQEVDERPGRHDDALGAAGRAGGVDHVGRVAGVRGCRAVRVGRVVVGPRVQLRARVGRVEDDDTAGPVGGQGVAVLPGGQQDSGPGLGQHQGDPVAREVRVDGKVCGARLEHGEQRDDQLLGAGQGERHIPLGAAAERDEVVRQPVGGLVQFPVGERAAPGRQGHGVGGPGGLLREQPGRGRRGDVGRGVVAAGQRLGAFGRVQQVEVRDGGAGRPGRGVHEAYEPVREQAGGGLVEQVGGELQGAADAQGAVAAAPFPEREVQVELRGVRADGEGPGGHAGQPCRGLSGSVGGGQHDLEEGVAGEGAFGLELLHEPLEGQVLVGVGRQVGLADPLQQLGERGITGGVGAQHERVDEAAHEPLHRLVAPPGHRGADRHVRARAQPGQQRGQRRLHHHEHAHPVLAGHPCHPCVQLGRHLELQPLAPVGGDRRTRPVHRQRQLLRQTRQPLPPELQLTAQQGLRIVARTQHLTLPHREIGVAERQFAPPGHRARAAGRVGGGQVLAEDAHGPAVGRDVVHEEEQHVVVVRHLEQPGAGGDVGGEVEGVPGGAGQFPLEPFGVRGDDGQVEAGVVPDHLVRPVGVLREHRAQRLVPGHDVGERGAQRVPVQAAGQAERHGQVVGGAGALEAVQEPEAFLGEGQRHPGGPGRTGVTGVRAVAAVSSSAASSATVVVSKTCLMESSAPRTVRTRETSRKPSRSPGAATSASG